MLSKVTEFGYGVRNAFIVRGLRAALNESEFSMTSEPLGIHTAVVYSLAKLDD